MNVREKVREARQRQLPEPPKGANPLPIIFGALLAFGLGALGVTGAIRAPQFVLAKPSILQTTSAANAAPVPQAQTILPAPRRIGRAENASLLPLCMPSHRPGMAGGAQNTDAGEAWRQLQSATGAGRVVTLAGLRAQDNEAIEGVLAWAEVADCIYRQNGWRLCDADNRALAAEAANAFVWQLDAVARAREPHARSAPFACRPRKRHARA